MASPYDDFDFYQQGEDWDYNDEMEIIFTHLVGIDILAERPGAAEAPDDALWFATDQGTFYWNDPDSGWTPTGGGQSGSLIPVGAFVDLLAETFQSRPQVRQMATEGSGTQADPYAMPDGLLDGYAGKVDFGKGWFETDGLSTDATLSYDIEAVYLEGDGIRTTTLLHAADAPSTPTVSIEGSGGNFGGLSDMTVYGAGEGDESGDAHIVESTGDVIDLTFKNVIIRYGGGDALHLAQSTSGTRIMNCWLENVGGVPLFVGGGNRVKVDNVHMIGGGIDFGATQSNLSNITVLGGGGQDGISNNGSRNTYSNVILSGNLATGIDMNNWAAISNAYIADCTNPGIEISDGAALANVTGANWNSDGGIGFIRAIQGETRAFNVYGLASDAGYSDRLLTVDDLHSGEVYVNGLGGIPSVDWSIDIDGGPTGVVLDNVYNVAYSSIFDSGTRTLINRQGTNDGDPRSTGEWNGEAEYAWLMDATIWDTSVAPWIGYEATGDGSDGFQFVETAYEQSHGHETLTGDGTQSAFTVAHGLASTPSGVDVTPTTEPASADHWVSADGSDVTVEYSAAPADGEPVEFYWEVRQ